MAVVVTEIRQALSALTTEAAAIKEVLTSGMPRPLGFQQER